ncbi:serine/threonine-protein kinase [Luteimonas aestuarii]|nr:serine/threonine-protein kinase [Luteimonas aestuarii]
MGTGEHEHDPDRTELLATQSSLAGVDVGDGLPPGTRLGRYRIQARVGHGGMGDVYRAEQLHPVRRTVALKLLRAQRLEARHKAYFELERQVLAQMRHPAIAQIYDADTTEDGQPYFAMEFIDGRPVTEYCQSNGLLLAQRIALFIDICNGVQHAHQKGVIHRDLKPGNLLVDEIDGKAHPKIIDFGIATAAALAETREVAGTPDYMSPEQAGGDQSLVDTRSDVYALGVVLCELLTGRRPATAGETMTDHERTLRLPSEQLATLPPGEAERLAKSQGRRLSGMRRVLRGELDWVVAKAMRHDRNARYASVAELADDLRRFLDGRVVQAVPASRWYASRKFVSRHRVGLAAASVAVAALVGGLALSLLGLMEAREQRAIAERRSGELEKVAAFQQSMLENIDIQGMGLGLSAGLRDQVARADPDRLPALDAVLEAASTTDIARMLIEREMLDRAELAIARDFDDQPALAADLREASGRVHAALGLYEKAAESQAAVAAYRASTLGPRDPATLRARMAHGSALHKLSRYDDARQVLESALVDAAALPDGDETRAGIELELSEVDALQGDLPEAVARKRGVVERLSTVRGEADTLTLRAMTGLALVLGRAGDIVEARALLEKVVPLRIEVDGLDDGDTLASMGALATMRAMQSEFEPAVAMQRTLAEAMIRRLGAEHPDTLAVRNNLANMLSGLGRHHEALAEAQAVLEARTRVLGAEHPQTLRTALNVASFHARMDDFDRGLPLEAKVLEARRRILGQDHPDTLFIQLNHGVTLQRAGRSRDALRHFDDGLPRALRVLGEKHPQYQAGLMMSGEALLDTGRRNAGIERLRQALALRKAHLPPDSPETPNTAWALVKALRLSGLGDEAAEVQRRDIDPLLAADPATLTAALTERRGRIEQQIREGEPGSRR